MITLLRTGAIFLVMTSAACVTADTSANSSDLEIFGSDQPGRETHVGHACQEPIRGAGLHPRR